MHQMFPPLHPRVDAMCKALQVSISSNRHKESEELIRHGIEMLKKLEVKDNQLQQKIDEIMVGTMVCVMIIHDRNKKDYPAYPHFKLLLDDPLHAYIPLIGRQILVDKTLPFNTADAAKYFPEIYNAFKNDHFERFNSEVKDRLISICSLR